MISLIDENYAHKTIKNFENVLLSNYTHKNQLITNENIRRWKRQIFIVNEELS